MSNSPSESLRPKRILLTGATSGIGLEAAKRLAAGGHHLLLHGRSDSKLRSAKAEVESVRPDVVVETFAADLSRLAEVDHLASAVGSRHRHLDVLINNAGVAKTTETTTDEGLDVRFMVNTIAPYHLTKALLPLLGSSGRVINISSATQAPVDVESLMNGGALDLVPAYSQSKLAMTMWTRHLAESLGSDGPTVLAVHPGSMLATKMVQDAFGVEGNDISIGPDLLERASLSSDFAGVTFLTEPGVDATNWRAASAAKPEPNATPPSAATSPPLDLILSPDRSQAYNQVTSVLGAVWHGWLGAPAATTSARWNTWH